MARPRKTNMRQRILDVAGEKFYQFGFSKVSVDELVAELRTSKSMIYRHFSSKEAIVRALLDHINNEINRKLESVVNDDSRSFSEKLDAITMFTGQVLSKVGKPFLDDLRTQTPELWDDYLEMRRQRLDDYYLHLMDRGIKEGVLRHDIDKEFLLLVYTKLTEIVVNPEQFQHLPVSNPQAYKWISSIFLEGTQKGST